MNNLRGQVLLEALRPAALVTVRTPEGREITGRAHVESTGPYIRNAYGMPVAVTAANIVRVMPQ